MEVGVGLSFSPLQAVVIYYARVGGISAKRALSGISGSLVGLGKEEIEMPATEALQLCIC
jgi:hypothetical protein